jgi:hypothetical protein
MSPPSIASSEDIIVLDMQNDISLNGTRETSVKLLKTLVASLKEANEEILRLRSENEELRVKVGYLERKKNETLHGYMTPKNSVRAMSLRSPTSDTMTPNLISSQSTRPPYLSPYSNGYTSPYSAPLMQQVSPTYTQNPPPSSSSMTYYPSDDMVSVQRGYSIKHIMNLKDE